MKKYIIILLMFLLAFLCSCRVAKKEWVKENFTEKATTQGIRVVQDSTFKSEISKIETSIHKVETSIHKIETFKTTENQTENTTVSGSITAEEGKEKSVTIGGTTIKSLGASVTFETTSSKAISKEFQESFQQISKELQEKSVKLQEVQIELNSLKSEFSNFVSTYQSEKNTKTKEVKNTGFPFGVWILIAIVLIVLAVVWYLRKSIPFLR